MSDKALIENCSIEDFGTGVDIDSDSGGGAWESTIIGGRTFQCGTGIYCRNAPNSIDILAHNIQSSTSYGLQVDEGAGISMVGGSVEGSGDFGVFVRAANGPIRALEVSGVYLEGNTTHHISLRDPGAGFEGATVENCYIKTATGDGSGVQCLAAPVTLDSNVVTSEADDAYDISGADVDIRGVAHLNNSIADSGTRTRVEGVIGGGPLGGVDISTVTGAEAGAVARTSGASAAPADVLAVFDGADWVYPTRGGTVTPS
jgi:hypothetical protein